MNKRNVAIYVRVSTAEQANEGYSIAAQINILRQYAILNGWEVYKEYADEGISGKSIKGRPAMQQLIKDMNENNFESILVWKISRLSRNMLDTLMLLDQFDKLSIKFVSYSENFDSGSPIGRLVIQLMASIAEMERNTLSENVKLGMKQRALEGYWNGGIILGYELVNKELVIQPKEANIVKLIFDRYIEDNGLKAITNYLNKNGYKTKKNKLFSINGVAQILDNPTYAGKIRWLQVEDWDSKRRKGKNENPILVKGKHEAIIDDTIWNLVQSKRKSKSFKQRQSNEPFLLNGLLKCLVCGKGMVPAITTTTSKDGTKKKHRYYECSTFHNKGSSACRSNSVRAYEAETTVIDKINNFITDDDSLSSAIKLLNEQSVHSISTIKEELKHTEEELNKVLKIQEKYLEAFEQNILPIEMLQERLIKVLSDKAFFEKQRVELNLKLSSSATKVVPTDLVKLLLNKFVEVYNQSSRDKKKQLLQLLIGTISITKLNNRSRTIKQLELDFDFSEVNVSNTFTLIHLLYRETDRQDSNKLITITDNKLPPYLQVFLPLFMVRFTLHNPECTVNLLHQH